jgi:hypothetical protein
MTSENQAESMIRRLTETINMNIKAKTLHSKTKLKHTYVIFFEVEPIARLRKRVPIIVYKLVGPSFQSMFNNVRTMPKGFKITYSQGVMVLVINQ